MDQRSLNAETARLNAAKNEAFAEAYEEDATRTANTDESARLHARAALHRRLAERFLDHAARLDRPGFSTRRRSP
jgi:wobble nucleotide-excising tRNase